MLFTLANFDMLKRNIFMQIGLTRLVFSVKRSLTRKLVTLFIDKICWSI